MARNSLLKLISISFLLIIPTVLGLSSHNIFGDSCAAPNECTNVTIYHNHTVLNVSSDVQAPFAYYPFDFGDADCGSGGNFTSENMMDTSDGAYCSGDDVNIISGSPLNGGKFLNFSNTDDFVHDPNLNFDPFEAPGTTNLTIEFWLQRYNQDTFRRMIVYYLSATEYIMINQHGNNGGTEHDWCTVGKFGDSTEYSRCYTTGQLEPDGEFHHLACVWSPLTLNADARDWSCWVDGVAASETTSGAWGVGTNPGLWVGNRNDLTGDFIGAVDELALYNYSMDEGQIQDHFNKGIRAKSGNILLNFTKATNNRANITFNCGGSGSCHANVSDQNNDSVFPSGYNHITLSSGTNKNVSLFLNGTGNLSPEFSQFNLSVWNEAAADTCTPPSSGAYAVTCSDSCAWSSADTIPGDITMTGSGTVTLSAAWSFTGSNQLINISSGCEFHIASGGIIQ